jgi:hypothetical protein
VLRHNSPSSTKVCVSANKMRKTLRRSCDACAKSKLSCDLRTPQCSRCVKRKSTCVYANQPLSLSPAETTVVAYNNPGSQYFDPFESCPQVRLPRAYVQRLIQHFLSTIAFQYYPLDLNGETNPFCVSCELSVQNFRDLIVIVLQGGHLRLRIQLSSTFPFKLRL